MDSPETQTDDIICQCHVISEAVIRSCIKAGDLNTVEQVTDACTAGGGCHSCHILIELFIDQKNLSARPMKLPPAAKGNVTKKRGVFSKLFARY